MSIIKQSNRSKGASKGWETRRRRQTARDNEWTDASFQAGREEGKKELRPLLEKCLRELEYFKLRHDDFKPDLLAELNRELKRHS